LKKSRIVHIIYKNFSCLDFYENIYLNDDIDLKIVITDLKLLLFKHKMETYYDDLIIPFPLGGLFLRLSLKDSNIVNLMLFFYIKLFNNYFYSYKILLNIVDTFCPDYFFIDQREFPETKKFHTYKKLLNSSDKKVYSIPHAPHYRRENDFVKQFSDNDIYISNVPINLAPENKDLVYIGYPQFNESKFLNVNHSIESRNILVLIRYFNRDNDDLSDDIEDIKFIFSNLPKGYDYVINPHPSVEISELIKILDELGVENYSITDTVPHISYKLCVSTFTTKILNLVYSGVPLLILNTTSFEFMRKWNFVDNLYCNLSGFCENKNIFQNKINNLENHIEDFNSEKNKQIINENYPANSTLIFKKLIT
jgi:hypothetical protein